VSIAEESIPPLRLFAAVAVVFSSAACASGGGLPAGRSPEQLPFASSLNVDFSKLTKSASGLYTRDLETGTGAIVSRGQTVEVRYTGWLNNGVQFDQTAPGEKPVSFKVGRLQVIKGWDEGIVGMRVGGKRQLVIPPDLGYGPDRKGVIPADATLVFVIEVVSTKA